MRDRNPRGFGGGRKVTASPSTEKRDESSSLPTKPVVIFEDNHLLGLFKPSGWLCQPDGSPRPSIWDWAKDYLKRTHKKPGNVFLGIVHRLDAPVSGVVVFAKTSKAASRLSASFRERTVRKVYRARIPRTFSPTQQGELIHFIDEEALPRVRVAWDAGAGLKRASLLYKMVGKKDGFIDMEIELQTGRRHQIRAQLAAMGTPIVGDKLYGSSTKWKNGAIALTATTLEFPHPVQGKDPVTIQLDLKGHHGA